MTSTLTQLRLLLETPEPPELGPGPRLNVQPSSALQKQIDALSGHSGLSTGALELIRATIFLWHDHLDAAHQLAQEIETSDGSYVHAIMHRREPDYGNAKYWFRRVGRHACFPALAARAGTLLQSSTETGLGQKVIADGQWDPFAFVDACEQVAQRPAMDATIKLLREIQRTEFELLLEHFCRG